MIYGNFWGERIKLMNYYKLTSWAPFPSGLNEKDLWELLFRCFARTGLRIDPRFALQRIHLSSCARSFESILKALSYFYRHFVWFWIYLIPTISISYRGFFPWPRRPLLVPCFQSLGHQPQYDLWRQFGPAITFYREKLPMTSWFRWFLWELQKEIPNKIKFW